MQTWVSPDVWRKAHECFARFDADDSWKALDKALFLFDRLAKEVARSLGFSYSEELYKNISVHISQLRLNS